MSFSSCCLRVLLMLSLALGGATPAMAAAAMLGGTAAHPGSAHAMHGAECGHAAAHASAVATQAHGSSATHSHDAGIAKAHAQHASHPSGADCDCCDGGKCDCTCMHAVSSIVISVASMLTSVPLHSRADARLIGAHAEPVRARLIRPPTVHAA